MNKTYTKPAEVELEAVYGFDLNAVCDDLDYQLRQISEDLADEDADENDLADALLEDFLNNQHDLSTISDYYLHHSCLGNETYPDWLHTAIVTLARLIITDKID